MLYRARVYGELSSLFETTSSVGKVSHLSIRLFLSLTGMELKTGEDLWPGLRGRTCVLVRMYGTCITSLDRLATAAASFGMSFTPSRWGAATDLYQHRADEEELEIVCRFSYLGSRLTEDDSKAEVSTRIAKARAMYCRIVYPILKCFLFQHSKLHASMVYWIKLSSRDLDFRMLRNHPKSLQFIQQTMDRVLSLTFWRRSKFFSSSKAMDSLAGHVYLLLR